MRLHQYLDAIVVILTGYVAINLEVFRSVAKFSRSPVGFRHHLALGLTAVCTDILSPVTTSVNERSREDFQYHQHTDAAPNLAV
jgi:hypothetical protein